MIGILIFWYVVIALTDIYLVYDMIKHDMKKQNITVLMLLGYTSTVILSCIPIVQLVALYSILDSTDRLAKFNEVLNTTIIKKRD